MPWTPPPRPDWVTELNAFGRVLDAQDALVPLDEASLLAAASAAAGGRTRFGDDTWREPLGVFLRALAEEADLTLVGRLMVRNEIVRSLRNGLLVSDQHVRHPELAGEAIAPPVLVTGTGRSGTSLLHELLAEDPRHRTLRTWEALHPVPPPERATYEHDPRVQVAHQEYATFWNLVTPEYATMHENAGDAPQEDGVLVMPTFLTDHFMGTYHVPTYAAHLAYADMAPVLAFHRRFLQLLQWRCPGDRWILKWPGFLSRLPDFLAAYPDTTILLTHRDPSKVLPSMVSLMATLRWQHSDAVDVDEIVQAAVHGSAYVLDRITRMRADGRLPDDRIVDVRYGDLVADPIGTVRAVYDRIGAELTADVDQRMRAYLAAKPKDRGGAHRYALADTGLDITEVRRLYEPYMTRYGITQEA